MHIPDGFLSIEVSAGMYIAAVFFLILAHKKAKKIAGDKHIPLLSVLAAGIFSAQMLNFPLIGAGGTSGHFLGAALTAIVLGPYGAVIVMALVLIVQALMFADGGITALGANIVNMGIVGGFGAYIVYSGLIRVIKSARVAAFFSGWSSVVLASIACSVQIAANGTVELTAVLIAMVLIHAIIGIAEGAITAGVLVYIQKTRPDILSLENISPGR